ncbi:hypothetical protein OG874_03630 [Nocardia sp. NBC_00565]|uniref:hypothetical protein n=1 Tax=Nocardia sp. NBC_00565 TaxID=2975993 RepID=UPI002E817A0A|nr:hypothetical protein [Nocardia sp. NBC_00565]WUC04309.1 hypothetical protein OG874_03630 [Nocardia sp. NBC_00565]
MFEIDPARVRELANGVRGHATTIAGKAPMAVPARDEARAAAKGSLALTRAEETLKALDGVLKFHAGRFSGIGDLAEKAANDFEDLDRQRAIELDQAGPR